MARAPLRVAYAGRWPDWLAGDAKSVLEEAGVELVTDAPDVVHIPRGELGRPGRGAACVVELGARVRRGRGTRGATVMLTDQMLLRPVDLERFVPRAAIAAQRERDLRLFRKHHRLAGPVLLYAGPLTRAGGLDSAVEAALSLSTQFPDLRLAALGTGQQDERYLARCEGRMLRLGHHGIVERAPNDHDLPLWFALASVVCCPATVTVDPASALYAAAAGVPVVATRPYFEHVVDEGRTGLLVAAGAQAALEAALARLLAVEEAREEMGTAGRTWAEQHLTPDACARSLCTTWLAAAS